MSESKIPAASLVRTVIVDDSAFVRKVVRDILSRNPFIDVVGMARDGEEALALVEELKPDVVVCDLIMPVTDGVQFVRRQMKLRPVPILILSASPADGEKVIQSFEAGAVDLVRKPTALANEELLSIREELVEKVKAAARMPLAKGYSAPTKIEPKNIPKRAANMDIVVIGISTGGPQALRFLLPLFPSDFPVPVAIVLHMPEGYTQMFAEKLNALSKLEVKEAEDGDLLKPGTVLLARAGRHLIFKKTGSGNVVAQLTSQPSDKVHRPAVDVLFQSAAETYRARTLGVVMTGMGEDGKQGAAWIKAQGGTVLTEAEESCVIYGMPRAVVESGLSDGAYPLERIALAIAERL